MGDVPEWAKALELEPHPEGGWYRETWRSPVSFTPDGYGSERASATAIYFLLAPGEESRRHRVRSAELWLWHRGGPLVLTIDSVDVVLGPEQPQVVVPPNAWQAARPADDEPVLVSCVVSPGFDFADFEMD